MSDNTFFVSSIAFSCRCYHISVSIFVDESGWTEEDGNKLQLAEFVSKILNILIMLI